MPFKGEGMGGWKAGNNGGGNVGTWNFRTNYIMTTMHITVFK